MTRGTGLQTCSGRVTNHPSSEPRRKRNPGAGRVEKTTSTTTTTKWLVRFFMEFRRPAAVGDRPQKPMVCPSASTYHLQAKACVTAWATG
jgi:hypothetical protein